MAKRGKPNPAPEPGPNVFEGPVRVGRNIGGQLVVDYPAELRDGVLLHRVYNGRDEPAGWQDVPLDGAGYAVSGATDADLAQIRAAGYDIEDGRGYVPFDRKGLTPPPGEAAAEPPPPIVLSADLLELDDLRRRLEAAEARLLAIDPRADEINRLLSVYLARADAAKQAKADYVAARDALPRVVAKSRETMPLFDGSAAGAA